MSYDKPPAEERRLVTQRIDKRQYGARTTVRLPSDRALGFRDGVGLSLSNGALAVIEPDGAADDARALRYSVELTGYRTAADAESAGKRLAFSLLWSSVSFGMPLQLEYATVEPCRVFDRTTGGGVFGRARLEQVMSFDQVAAELNDVFDSGYVCDDRTLLSLELFCAAPMETSQRTRFISTVSALEPLALQKPLSTAVDKFVDDCVASLAQAEVDEPMVTSLRGRLLQLKRDSVRQALLRLLRKHFVDRADLVVQLDEAYGRRSDLIHEGRIDPDIDLPRETQTIRETMRELYARMLSRPLKRAAQLKPR